MSGHHPFDTFRAQMTLERRARNTAKTQALLADIPLHALQHARAQAHEELALTGDRPMRTIETTATITAEGTLTVQVPPDIPPGPHHVVVLIDDQLGLPEARPIHDFPVIHVGAWPADLSLRREDMYGDEGR